MVTNLKTTELQGSKNYTLILKSHFNSFCSSCLVKSKGGPGTRLTAIKDAFQSYLESVGSEITELSNIQMGLLMQQSEESFVRRKTAKGACYLVSVVTPVI